MLTPGKLNLYHLLLDLGLALTGLTGSDGKLTLFDAWLRTWLVLGLLGRAWCFAFPVCRFLFHSITF